MKRITTNKLLIIFLEVFIALALWNAVMVNQELEDPTRIGKMVFFLWMVGPIVLVRFYQIKRVNKEETIITGTCFHSKSG